METSSLGSTLPLMAYGGSWSLVDISTNESLAAASSDNGTLCLVDGCYEITYFLVQVLLIHLDIL